jgi:hypothetical protein
MIAAEARDSGSLYLREDVGVDTSIPDYRFFYFDSSSPPVGWYNEEIVTIMSASEVSSTVTTTTTTCTESCTILGPPIMGSSSDTSVSTSTRSGDVDPSATLTGELVSTILSTSGTTANATVSSATGAASSVGPLPSESPASSSAPTTAAEPHALNTAALAGILVASSFVFSFSVTALVFFIRRRRRRRGRRRQDPRVLSGMSDPTTQDSFQPDSHHHSLSSGTTAVSHISQRKSWRSFLGLAGVNEGTVPASTDDSVVSPTSARQGSSWEADGNRVHELPADPIRPILGRTGVERRKDSSGLRTESSVTSRTETRGEGSGQEDGHVEGEVGVARLVWIGRQPRR